MDYNLAYIPLTFKAEHTEDFDTEYMRQLYTLGYELAVKGYPWQKTPPGYTGPGPRCGSPPGSRPDRASLADPPRVSQY